MKYENKTSINRVEKVNRYKGFLRYMGIFQLIFYKGGNVTKKCNGLEVTLTLDTSILYKNKKTSNVNEPFNINVYKVYSLMNPKGDNKKRGQLKTS